jgi:hypothetical protein
MSLMFEKWNNYLNETKIHKRIVLNNLTEVTIEQLEEFPLNDDELLRIKEWGDLDGDPLFLGSGTMGSAFQFGSKVLKITKDSNEARAASLIAGQYHPNVYRVHKVAKRYRQVSDEVIMPNHNFLIVYDLVASEVGGPDLPNQEQQAVIKNMYSRLRDIYYNWVPDFPDIKKKFLDWAKQNETALNSLQISRFERYDDQLEDLISKAGIQGKDKTVLMTAWGSTAGFYGPENITTLSGVEKVITSPSMRHINDVSKGLTFLEKNGVHFTDLKTTNVMNDNGRLVIIDIGKSSTKGSGDIPTISS